MAGRAWYSGPVELEIIVKAPDLPGDRTILAYGDGITDTIDGSHGPGFTYLPIVLEDDCQVVAFRILQWVRAPRERYSVTIWFT